MPAKKSSAKKSSAKKASAKKASAKKASAKKASAKKASGGRRSLSKPTTRRARRSPDEGAVDPDRLAHSLGDSMFLSTDWDDEEVDIRYGYWDGKWDSGRGAVYVPDMTSFSDYSGGSVERSNFEVFTDLFKDDFGPVWKTAYGGHGTRAIVIKADRITPEINDFFLSLDEYPVADENELSELEHELENEAWENWARSDFVKALDREYSDWGDQNLNEPDFSEILSEDKTFELFRKMAEEANQYWEIESGGNAYIRIEDVIENGLDGSRDEIESILSLAGFVRIPEWDDDGYPDAVRAAVILGKKYSQSPRPSTFSWMSEESMKDAFANQIASSMRHDEDVGRIAGYADDDEIMDSLFDFFIVGVNS